MLLRSCFVYMYHACTGRPRTVTKKRRKNLKPCRQYSNWSNPHSPRGLANQIQRHAKLFGLSPASLVSFPYIFFFLRDRLHRDALWEVLPFVCRVFFSSKSQRRCVGAHFYPLPHSFTPSLHETKKRGHFLSGQANTAVRLVVAGASVPAKRHALNLFTMLGSES